LHTFIFVAPVFTEKVEFLENDKINTYCFSLIFKSELILEETLLSFLTEFTRFEESLHISLCSVNSSELGSIAATIYDYIKHRVGNGKYLEYS